MYQAGPEIERTIEEYKAVLRRKGINVERLILYGSFAKGTQNKNSDIDLIVVSDDFQRMNLRQRLEVLGVAAARIMKPIEAQGYTSGEIKSTPKISFLSEALRLGISL